MRKLNAIGRSELVAAPGRRHLRASSRSWRRLLHWGMLALWALVVVVRSPLPGIAQTQGCVPNTPNYPCLYVANIGDGTVSALSTSTNGPVATIPVDGAPNSTAVTPDNLYLYIGVEQPSGPSVVVLSTPTNTPTKTIPVSGVPNFIAITHKILESGESAYLAEPAGGRVEVINTLTNTVGQVTPIGSIFQFPYWIAIAPDDSRAYVTDNCGPSGVNCLDKIDLSTNTATFLIDLPGPIDNPGSIVVTPDVKYAYISSQTCANPPVCDTWDAQVTVVDLSIPELGQPIPITDMQGQPVQLDPMVYTRIAITPDGHYVYATFQVDVHGTPLDFVYVIDTSTNKVVQAPTVGTQPFPVASTPDGKYVYVGNYQDNTLSVISTQDYSVGGPLPVGEGPVDIAIMPNLPPACAVSVSPPSGVAPLLVSATASCSDPENDITVTTIYWGDGTSTPGTSGTHTYTDPGTYSVTASATDISGQIGTSPAQQVLVSLPSPPTCAPVVQSISSLYSISVTANCTPSGTIVSITIDWGDGKPPASGSSADHTYDSAGTYTVTVSATDEFKQVGSKSLPVVLAAPPPPGTAGQQTTLTFSVPAGTPASTFECTNAIGPDGSLISDLSTVGIGCSFSSTNNPNQVSLTITTTGGGLAVLHRPHMSTFSTSLAFWMPFPAIVLLGSGVLGCGSKRNALRRWVTIGLVMVFLAMLVSCGGGFTPRPPQRLTTPPGTYYMTAVSTDPITGFQQLSLIVPLTVTGP
jgi:YVTN family beta-propeller protein